MQWKFELLMKPPAAPLTEGPVWDGEHLYFTHIRASRIMRYEPGSGVIAEARAGTNRTNGLCFDADGRLFGCCSGGRAILRFDPDGKNAVIADRVLETHPVPAIRPTNCCFGGRDMTTLFVTTTQGHFFKAETNRVGWAMYP